MSKIRVLDDSTVNKIAAGEVVERPYSIVKELVENSVDAFSTSITIEVKNGGKSYIRVTDNGSGIDSEDMEIAFLRHSTSKIRKVEDLYNVLTLGFRGEALASIASVSQVEVISKTRESERGKKILIYSGEIQENSEVGTSNGTSIIVRNLFYNVPVRKKFLKSDASENGAISDLVYRLSLGNPSIAFKYIKDGAILLKTPGSGDVNKTMYSLFGKDFIESTNTIYKSKSNISISGRTSKSTFSRGNRSHQYIFVNGRSVKSLAISKKIEALYRGVIPVNRFPVFVFFIELDPRDVDVNIHPSKTEVRFLKEEDLLEVIDIAVRSGLSDDTACEFKLENSKKTASKTLSSTSSKATLKVKKEINEIEKNPEPRLLDPKLLYDRKDNKLKSTNRRPSKKSAPLQYSTNRVANEKTQTAPQSVNEDREKLEKSETISKLPKLRVIGLLFNTYILCEDSLKGEFFMIDQHAAHERVMYEKLSRELSSDNIYTQDVLALEPITLNLSDMEKLRQHSDFFAKLGFSFEEFGQNAIVLRGVPLVFGVPNFNDLFIDILDNLDLNVKNSYDLRLEKLMKLACTSAVKAGYTIKTVEIERLIEELGLCEKPFTCPHGRPTIVKLTKSEVEKKFKRI